MERSKVGTNKRRPDGLYIYNKKDNNNKHNIMVFYKIWKKYDEIQWTKNKMDLNNRNEKSSPGDNYYTRSSEWSTFFI